MKSRLNLLLLLAALWVPVSAAHEYQSGDIRVDHPWSRPTPPGTSMGVGYLSITNGSDQDVVLVRAETPRAGRVSIHQTTMTDGVMRMQPLSGGLSVPAGQTVELKPHGYHLMLEQLRQPLAEDERVPLTLYFDQAAAVEVELAVEPLDGEMAKDSGMKMDHSGHQMEH